MRTNSPVMTAGLSTEQVHERIRKQAGIKIYSHWGYDKVFISLFLLYNVFGKQ